MNSPVNPSPNDRSTNRQHPEPTTRNDHEHAINTVIDPPAERSRHGGTGSPRPGGSWPGRLSGVAAVTLAACGSSSSASTTTSTAAHSSGRQRWRRRGTRPASSPGPSGTIAAINGTSLEVQNPNTGQTTVSYTPTTTFEQTITATASGVTVGSCISAFGKPTNGSSSSTTPVVRRAGDGDHRVDHPARLGLLHRRVRRGRRAAAGGFRRSGSGGELPRRWVRWRRPAGAAGGFRAGRRVRMRRRVRSPR